MDFSASTVTVTSYNAHNINDGTNYRARIPHGTPLMADNNPTYAERLDEYPLETRTQLKERTIPIVINTVAGTAETLKMWFNEGRATRRKLILTDSSDSSTWYVYAKLKSFNKRRDSTNVYDVVLSVGDSVWRKNTTSTSSWSVTTSGQTQNVTVGGTEFARPIITVTPRVLNTDGYAYRRFVVVYNKTGTTFTNYPLNVTGGNFDHASLVSGSKAQADGDDFRCFYDGEEKDMWTGGGGWNSATLRPWINIDLQPKIELTTLGAIAGSGAVATISIAPTQANLIAMWNISRVRNKLILIDSELFTFTGATYGGGELEFTGCARQARGTSPAAHSAGATVRWIEHDIWLYYGWSAATALTLDSAREPLIDKTNSTNTSWVYTDYFDEGNPGRPGSWSKGVITSSNQGMPEAGRSGHYGANRATNVNFESIASEMGMSIKAWYKTVWRADLAELEWKLYHPAGVTTVTASGEKYRVGTAWPFTVGFQYSVNGGQWADLWTEATPSSASTWESLASHSAVSLGGTYRNIRFVMHGTIRGIANNLAHIEHDSITLALASGNAPSVTVGSEMGCYYVNVKIKNDTTGDFVKLRIPGAVDAAIVVNCDLKTVVDSEGINVLSALTYGPDTVRQNWLTLDPTQGGGVNVIRVTETGIQDMDIDLAWEARSI